MKNIIIKIGITSFAIAFLFNINFVLADDCGELRPIIDKYYKASQEENIDAYMSVMDQDYLRENLLDNYEDYVKAAWEVYDTKKYELNPYNCRLEENDALMYFNMKSTLVSNGEEVEIQKNYVALFDKLDTWKIKYVVDEDVFSQFQDALTSQLYLDATKDITYDELDKADDLIAYDKMVQEIEKGNYQDNISEGVENRDNNLDYSEGKSSSKLFVTMIVVTGLLAGTIFYYKKKKRV